MFWFFGHKACGSLAPWWGVDPVPPAVEGKYQPLDPPPPQGKPGSSL